MTSRGVGGHCSEASPHVAKLRRTRHIMGLFRYYRSPRMGEGRLPMPELADKTDVQTLDNFIGGRWVKSHASEFFDVHNPASGDVISRTPLSTRADVDAAVDAATRAFPAWRETPVNTRAQVLYKFKARLEQHFDDLAR